MNCDQFNEKYKEYLEEGHYGMSIEHKKVIKLVDEKFQEWIKLPGFAYTQIKLKFGYARVYAEAKGVNLDTDALETAINEIV